MEPSVELRFVKDLHGYSSIREKELESSERRAHAAKVAHRRLKRTDTKSAQRGDQSNMSTQFATLRCSQACHINPSKPDPGETRDYGRIAKSTYTEKSRQRSFERIAAEQQCEIALIGLPFKGSSDPFQSRGVAITAQINRVITFIREVALPSFYCNHYFRNCALEGQHHPPVTETSSVIFSRAAAREWRQIVANLDNRGSALACLAAFLALISKFAGKQSQRLDAAAGLKLRVKSSALLREVLRNQDNALPVRESVVLQMFWLFSAEAVAGNLEAAAIHGTMMWRIIKSGMASKAIDLGMLVHFLYVDVNLAVKYMGRPLFDVEFCTKRIQPLWDRTLQIIPQERTVNVVKLPECVDFQPLRDIMIADRLYRELPDHPLPMEEDRNSSSGDLIFGFVASRTLIDKGRLVSYYLDLQDGTTEDVRTLSDGVHHTRAAMALAMTLVMLCYMRSVGHIAYIQGFTIREDSDLTILRLNDAVIKALYLSTADEMRYYQKARLWVLFLGAMYMQQQRLCRPPIADIEDLLFSKLLALECHRAGVATWLQMHAILTEFSYGDMLKPHGSLWFERF